MSETIQRKLNDSPVARWTALLLIASTMFFGYMFVDLMSPLQSMIEAQRGWTPDVFGMYGSSEFILNVFGFLILAGIILDKMGVRFTGQLSASLMFIGACLKYYAVSDSFAGSGIEMWLNSWWSSFPASAKLASLGFMIFGCGMEMAGITVSKAIPNGSKARRWLWPWDSKWRSRASASSQSSRSRPGWPTWLPQRSCAPWHSAPYCC